MTSNVFTEEYFRYLGEQLELSMHSETHWQRLQARIQDLPFELRLIILKTWMSDNAPKLINGNLEHPLLTDTLPPSSKTEMLALYHSGPIILERSVERNQSNGWSRSEHLFFLSMEWPVHHDPWLPKTPPFAHHDKLCARQGRDCIRIVCRLVVFGSRLSTKRISYNSSGEITTKFKGWALRRRVPWLETFDERAEWWSHRIAARNGVPRENVSYEILFMHKCAWEHCTGTHLTYEIPRAATIVLAGVAFYALASLYQGIQIAVGGKAYWREFCEFWAGSTEDVTTRVLHGVVLIVPATVIGTVLWIFAQILIHAVRVILLAGRAKMRFWWGVLREVQKRLDVSRVKKEKDMNYSG